MTRRMDDVAAGEAGRSDRGGSDRPSRGDEAVGEAVLELANAARVSSGDVARSVETARRAAVMDVVPAWASAGRDGPIPDVAPPRAGARLVEEETGATEAMEEPAEVMEEVNERRGTRSASSLTRAE